MTLGTALNSSSLVSKKSTNSLLPLVEFFFKEEMSSCLHSLRSREHTPGLQSLLASVIIGKCVGGASKQD